MPIIKRKNINRARDMETFQNRNRTSTTVAFWVMNMTTRLTKIRININLRFTFLTFAPAAGHQQSNMSE
jgi:hypothetical protein